MVCLLSGFSHAEKPEETRMPFSGLFENGYGLFKNGQFKPDDASNDL